MSDTGGFRLDRVRTMIAAPTTALRHRGTLAMLLCAVLFFLGTADLVFSFRIQGVNVRIANLLLAGGLVTWLLTRRADSARDIVAASLESEYPLQYESRNGNSCRRKGGP